MSGDPSVAVQGALVSRLKAEIGSVSGRVHDRAPQDVAFPHLQVGEIQIVDDGVDCLEAVEVFATIHVWSRAVGSVEARTIAGACRAALHGWLPDLAAAGWRCVDHLHRDTRVMGDPDGKTTHGILVFRLLVDPL
jgi:hypothetical protein